MKQHPDYVNVDGHSFHKKSVAAYKSEKDFISAANDEGNAKIEDPKNHSSHKEGWFPGDPNREDKLKQVYALCTIKAAKVAPEVAAPSVTGSDTGKAKAEA